MSARAPTTELLIAVTDQRVRIDLHYCFRRKRTLESSYDGPHYA
jgi:hypothetical protein